MQFLSGEDMSQRRIHLWAIGSQGQPTSASVLKRLSVVTHSAPFCVSYCVFHLVLTTIPQSRWGNWDSLIGNLGSWDLSPVPAFSPHPLKAGCSILLLSIHAWWIKKTKWEVTDYFNFITWVKCLALGKELKSIGTMKLILKITKHHLLLQFPCQLKFQLMLKLGVGMKRFII